MIYEAEVISWDGASGRLVSHDPSSSTAPHGQVRPGPAVFKGIPEPRRGGGEAIAF